ncbi:MAG: GspE/PulE family protein [Candidatus Eremiobacteraeota bacterium]|nr:GspE/PulE family protein [Candidatus Eremiobacteraeota bacterium]
MNSWTDLLKESCDPSMVEQARAEEAEGRDGADFLIKGRHASPADVLAALSGYHDLPAMLVERYEPQEEAVEKIPEDIARRFGIMPLFILKETIYAATSQPGDLNVEDFVRQLTGLSMREVVSTRSSIEQTINRHYLAGERSAEKVKSIVATKQEEEKVDEIARARNEITIEDSEAPSIRLVNHIISSGIRLGASDIHLEPLENRAFLRYRMDGVLKEFPPPPLDMIRSVTSRIKILSDMDVAEKRLPQDGRITFNVDGKDYDLRVSLIPNLYGESIVIRILASSADVKSLKNLGFNDTMLTRYKKMIRRPHGVILVTGPTGSGKSTTLYATLRHLYTPEKKILTLEDPVESKMEGITQFQMNAPIGFTFARTLRAVLRHDPEIVLVGEIRDQETAEIAIRASLTGHLILSTLHTNDASSAPTRLIDMGVQGYLVMTSLVGVLAQRLVRRLCTTCREPLEVDDSVLFSLGITGIPEGAAPYRNVGCTQCQDTGYKGRAAIYELLEITNDIRRLPEHAMTAENIRAIAEKSGFVNLRESGLEKWFQGVTSMEEVIKLTVE